MPSRRRIVLDPQENIYINCETTPSSHLPSHDDPDAATEEATVRSPRPTTLAKNHHKPKGRHDHGGLDMDEIDRTMFFTPSDRQTVSCGTVAVDLRRGRILSLYNKKLGIAQLPKGRKRIGEDHIDAALRETLEESGIRVRPLPLKVWTRSSAVPPEQQDRQSTEQQQQQQQLPVGLDESNMPTPPASAGAPSVDNEDGASGSGGGSAPGSVSGRSSTYAESPMTECAAATCAEQSIPTSSSPSRRHSHRHRRMQCCCCYCPDKDVTSDVFNNEFIGVVRYPDPQSQTPGTRKSIYWFAATFDLGELDRAGGVDADLQEHEKFVVCAYNLRDTMESLRFQAEKEVVRKLVADLDASGIRLGGEEDDGWDDDVDRCHGYEMRQQQQEQQ